MQKEKSQNFLFSHGKKGGEILTGYTFRVGYCSVSRRRPQKVDKRMVLEHTHGLFIT